MVVNVIVDKDGLSHLAKQKRMEFTQNRNSILIFTQIHLISIIYLIKDTICLILAPFVIRLGKYELTYLRNGGTNMIFKTLGDKSNPAILFFHAMGVTGDSSMPVTERLADKYFCIMPTSTVYCKGQKYISKQNEVDQVIRFLKEEGIKKIELVVASSIGADLAMAFLNDGELPVKNVFFDGGQFAQIKKSTRKIMVPFLYLAIKSLYWSKGKTLKKIMWCDDENIKPYFIEAGRNLTYRNLRRQLMDSLEDKEFTKLSEELQKHAFWEFGNKEDHFKYRDAVMQAYEYGNFPVFDGYNHMQYQIRDPEGFAKMLETIIETGKLPELPFLI